MNIVKLKASPRTESGNQVNAVRRAGMVPANIVSSGKPSRMLQLEYNPLLKVLNRVGYTQPVALDIGETEPITALVTNVDFHPAKGTVSHVVFQEVRKGEKFNANVPLRIVGDAPATVAGCVLVQVLNELEVTCGALSIPEHIDVDVSGLKEDGEGVRASELNLPEGVEMLTDSDSTIVKAEMPRVVEEPEEDEDTETGDTEAASAESETSAETKQED